MIYIALIIAVIICYLFFRRIEKKITLLYEEQYVDLINSFDEAEEKNVNRHIEISDQIYEVNQKLNFYFNNSALVEKKGFVPALKEHLEKIFEDKGYSKPQAKFKAHIIAEHVPFNKIDLYHLSNIENYSIQKNIKWSRHEIEEKFRSVLMKVEFEKFFFKENELKKNAYCLINKIFKNKQTAKKELIFFTTTHPLDLIENSYYLFLEKFFLLDYLMNNGIITKIDYRKQSELGLSCLPSKLCLKVNNKQASKFLDENRYFENKCDEKDIDWFLIDSCKRK